MPTFLAFDFETADNGADSACSIGLVRVEKGRITQEAVHLIRPPRERFLFTHIHGLRWHDCREAPTFGLLWPTIAPLFAGVDFVVAHNVSFDRRVLHACLEVHQLEHPQVEYRCSVQLARKAFGIHPTKLSNVCAVLGIELQHHEALSDARACAQIVLRAHRLQETKQTAPAMV